MAIDIRGSLKSTKLKRNIFSFVDELLANSIDSYLIRKSKNPIISPLNIQFKIEFFATDLQKTDFNLSFSCTDFGDGFQDNQTTAFVTKDTSFKDDLEIEGIGECRGSGRVQFFHFFRYLDIDSTFSKDDVFYRRKLSVDFSMQKTISENSFTLEPVLIEEYSTTIKLRELNTKIFEILLKNRNLLEVFSGDELKNHVLVTFLQRLIGLKGKIGEFEISFKNIYEDDEKNKILTHLDLPVCEPEKSLNIHYLDEEGNETVNFEQFNITHYKIDRSHINIKRNAVSLCANSSVVRDVKSHFIKSKTIENDDINGYFHLIFISSNYLDKNVNSIRDGFDIPHNRCETLGMLSYEEILNAIEDEVIRMISPPGWERNVLLTKVKEKYGISEQMISESKVRVRYGDTSESIAQRCLHSFQSLIIKDTSEIFEIHKEIMNINPDSETFRDKINQLSWKYASSISNIDKTSLSQLVVRRAMILEVLGLAIDKCLNVQTALEKSAARRNDERIIHQIFFPMGKDSSEVSEHDIWLLNDEFCYFSYISSDKRLSSIKIDDKTLLFQDNVDEELEEIFQKNYKNNEKKRPDIAIFSKEGAVVIIEFKSPDEDLDQHIGDLMEYSQLLAAKSSGRLKKFYGYLIGCRLNSNRMIGYTKFPSDKGWFSTHPIIEQTTHIHLGELYSEILFYNDLVSKASSRLEVFRKRLGVDMSS